MLVSASHRDTGSLDVLKDLINMRNVDGCPPASEVDGCPPASEEVSEDDILVNSRQLRQILPVCDMTIRRWEKDPEIGFPPRIKLNGGHVFWKLSSVRAWINHRAGGRATSATANDLQEFGGDDETPAKKTGQGSKGQEQG